MTPVTYQNDDSFFIVLVPKMNIYLCWPVYKWLLYINSATFRMIQDAEIEAERPTLSEVQKIYPGIGSIGIVMNPWARVVHKFLTMQEDTAQLLALSSKFPNVDFTNFDSVVKFFKDFDVNSAALMPQSHWLTYESPTGIVQSNFIIRGEHVEEDCQPIQDYFCANDIPPASFKDFQIMPLEYKHYYNSETKEIVNQRFADDIERFKYTF